MPVLLLFPRPGILLGTHVEITSSSPEAADLAAGLRERGICSLRRRSVGTVRVVVDLSLSRGEQGERSGVVL